MKKLIPVLLAAMSFGCLSVQADAPISIFDGKTLNGWVPVPVGAWTVTNGALAMTGTARGVLYTANKYTYYRVLFSVRQVKGVNHYPCQLVFGTSGDALHGIQFELPFSSVWDYRSGHNNSGSAFFKRVGSIPGVKIGEWARCEILVDARTGTARAAAAQPIGTKAIELADFKDSAIPNLPTPFAFQSHNAGQFDEYKDITIEVNPAINDLITTKTPDTGGFTPTVYEGEAAVISPGVVESTNAGFSGTGYANTTNVAGAFVEWTVTVPAVGDYTLDFRFANGYTPNRASDLRINGALVQSAIAFPSTGAFTTWSDVVIKKPLVAGANKIRLTATTANGCANLDKLTVSK